MFYHGGIEETEVHGGIWGEWSVHFRDVVQIESTEDIEKPELILLFVWPPVMG